MTKVTKIGLAAFGAVCLLALLPTHRVPPPGGSAPASLPDPNEAAAALINANGQLCAKVERITKLKVANAYEVECIQYRGGTSRASYTIDMTTGRATRQ